MRRTFFIAAPLLCATFAAFAQRPLSTAEIASGQIRCDDRRALAHNPRLVKQTDREVCFEAYVSSFSTTKMRDRRTMRFVSVPHWVSQKVSALAGHLAEGRDRPPSWFSIPELQELDMAATDASYEFTKKFRATERHDDWYERGHLAPKYLAERLQPPTSRKKEGPGWYTHNIANAVPQRGAFNKKPWFTLECYTGAWANHYGAVWVIAGPVFDDDVPAWLKSDKNKNALPVAIPDRLFKVVVKRDEAGTGYDVLAFIYKQKDARYERGPWDPLDYVVSVEHIEQLTRIEFFPGLAGDGSEFRHTVPTEIWAVDRRDFDPSCRRVAPKEEEG